jgi:hypothetical protein
VVGSFHVDDLSVQTSLQTSLLMMVEKLFYKNPKMKTRKP